MANRTDLIEEYTKVARIADRRLRKLEELSKVKNFKKVKKFAYRNAMRDIKYWGGGKRFGTGQSAYKGLSNKQLQKKINDIKTFLKMKSSTKRDIVNVYQRRANTLNNYLKLEGKERITWEEMAEFWRSDLYKEMQKTYADSDTLVKIMAQFANNRESIIDAIKNQKFEEITVEPEFLNKTTEDFLKANGTEFKKLFNKKVFKGRGEKE